MNWTFALASSRFYLRHPWQLALAIAGISLGVAVYVGVDLANDSARRAFELSSELLRGQTSHRLLPVGGEMPETHYSSLLIERRVSRAAPIIEIPARIGGPTGIRQTILGVDPVKELGFRDYSSFVPGRGVDFSRLITEPGAALIPETLATELELVAGSPLDLWIEGQRNTIHVVGTIQSLAAAAETEPPIVIDISSAQEISGRSGVISRIDLSLTAEQARELAASPPPGTTLVSATSQNKQLSEMTQAFRTNLTALGLLALVVGMFLIYSTMSFSIVQRRAVIGTLRAIGVSRGEILGSMLFEAFVIGLLGTLIGLVLGTLLAQGLVGMVLQTIGDLYFSNALSAAAASKWIYVTATVLGLGATLLAALVPSLDASRSSPDSVIRRSELERNTRARAKQAAILSVPTLLLAALLLFIESQRLIPAFAGMFFVLCAGAMLTPTTTMALMRLLEPAAKRSFGLAGLMAIRGVSASLSRTGVATAALAVAVATVIGIGLMIGSFRASLVSWLDTTLTADIYLSLDQGASDSPLSSADVAAIEALPEVRGVSLTRFTRLPTERGEIGLRAFQAGPDGWGLDVVGDGAAAALARLDGSDLLMISEPFAFRFGIDSGDSIALPTADGEQNFEIAGIFRDYSTGGGMVVMSLDNYRRHWRDTSITGVGIHLAGEDQAGAIAAIQSAVGGNEPLRLRSTDMIERISLTIFDRTFQITEVLRLLAGLIAFLGVLSAVLAIQLEKARELAILRGLGVSPREMGTLVLTQTGLLGVAASVAALPLGSVLAALLVHVINRRSFGWSMDLIFTPGPLLLGVLLAISAALLAGIYPAVHSSRSLLGSALRDE